MAQGAYENPTLYGVDFTQGTEILQKGMDKVAASLKNIEEQRVEARQKLEDDFAEFKDITYVDKIAGVSEGINNSIRESAANFVSLADFSTMSPEEKQRAMMSAKDAKAGKEAIGVLEEAIQNNVLDSRIPPEQTGFMSDLLNNRNIEYKPDEKGIGFKLVHTYTDTNGKSKKIEYDSAKLAMMTTQFQDIEPTLAEVAGAEDRSLKELQAKKKALNEQGLDVSDDTIRKYASTLNDRINGRNAAIFYAEYVNKGAELSPKFILNENGEKVELSREEIQKITEVRKKELEEYLFSSLKERLYPSQRKYSDAQKFENQKGIAKINSQNRGRQNPQETISDENLYNGLSNMGLSYKKALFGRVEGVEGSGLPVPTESDQYSIVNRSFMLGDTKTTIVDQDISNAGVLNFKVEYKAYDEDIRGYDIVEREMKVDLKEDGAVDALYKNILRASNSKGQITTPNQNNSSGDDDFSGEVSIGGTSYTYDELVAMAKDAGSTEEEAIKMWRENK